MGHFEQREGVAAAGHRPVPPEVEPPNSDAETESDPDQERQEWLQRIWWLAQRRGGQPGAQVGQTAGATLTRHGDTDTDISIHFNHLWRGCELKVTVRYSPETSRSTVPGVCVAEDVYTIRQHPKRPFAASRTTTCAQDPERREAFAEFCRQTGREGYCPPWDETCEDLDLDDLQELNMILMGAQPRARSA